MGREFAKTDAEFAGCIAYAPAFPVGKDKFDVRWKMEGGSLVGHQGGEGRVADWGR